LRNEIFWGTAFLLLLNAIFSGGEGKILQSLSPLILIVLLFLIFISNPKRKDLIQEARGISLQRSPLYLPLLLLALFHLLSFVFSLSRGNSVERLYLELAFIATAFLAIQLFPSKRRAGKAGVLLLLLALFEVFYAVGQRLFLGVERVTGTFNYATFFIDLPLVGFALVLGFVFFESLVKWKKALLLSTIPFFLLAFLWSGTRAVLPSLFSILLLLGIRKGRKVRILVVLFTLFLLLLTLLFPNPLRDRYMNEEKNIYSFQRGRIWMTSLKVFRDHPLFGVGLGNFEFISPPYNFPVESAVGRYARKVEIPHNEYLSIACQSGIFVLLSFFLLVYFGTRSGFRLSNLGGVYFGSLSGMIALLIHFLFDNPLYLPLNGFLFYFLIGLLGSHPEKIRSSLFDNSKFPLIHPRRARIYLIILFLTLAFHLAKPIAASLYYQNAIREAKQGNYRDAIRFCRKASILQPSDAIYYNALGTLYSKRFEEIPNPLLLQVAYIRYRTAIDLHAIEPFYREDFAHFLYTQREELEKLGLDVNLEIQNHLHESISLDPFNPFYRRKLGALHAELGDKEKGTRILEEVLVIEPHYLLARYQLIHLYRELGKIAEAQKHYEILLSHLEQNLHERVQVLYEKDLITFDRELLKSLNFK
jgi:O-antigen ligase